MCPFSVTVEHVPDRELGAAPGPTLGGGLRESDHQVRRRRRSLRRASVPVGLVSPDLPDEWRLLREREGESYRWPKRHDGYSPYRVFMGTTRAEGAVQIGLGETIRENAWGRDRKYVVAFLSGGSPQHPLVEFVAADDFEDTRELVAVIRGSDGGRRMYGVGDQLPDGLRGALPDPDLQRAGRPSGRLEQGRRRRPRGRRRHDAQPRADPEPTALPHVDTPEGSRPVNRPKRDRMRV